MATTRIYGVDERPSQPSFYIPNRVDEESLGALVKALGGVENVAFMVEEVLKPAPEVMKLVNTGKVLSFNFRQSNSRALREQLMNFMQEGLDVIFVPGRPNSIIGTLSDVPMPFMMQLGALHIAPVPVFVGGFHSLGTAVGLRLGVECGVCLRGDEDGSAAEAGVVFSAFAQWEMEEKYQGKCIKTGCRKKRILCKRPATKNASARI